MKILAQSIFGNVARLAKTRYQELDSNKDIPCWGDVFVEDVNLLYGNETHDHRPYLKLRGYVNRLYGEFPYGITEVDFGLGDIGEAKPDVELNYNFTDDELAILAQKGLFNKGFEIPAVLTEQEFKELPLECDVLSVPPERQGDVPLLFIGINSAYEIPLNSKNSGYELTGYFDKIVVKEAEQVAEIERPIEYTDEKDLVDDLFEKDESTLANELVSEEEILPELSEEDLLIYEAWTNVKNRVSRKLNNTKASEPIIDRNMDRDIDKNYQQDEPELESDTIEDLFTEDSVGDILEDDDMFFEPTGGSIYDKEEPEPSLYETIKADTIGTKKVASKKLAKKEDNKSRVAVKQHILQEKIKPETKRDVKREVPSSFSDLTDEMEGQAKQFDKQFDDGDEYI